MFLLVSVFYINVPLEFMSVKFKRAACAGKLVRLTGFIQLVLKIQSIYPRMKATWILSCTWLAPMACAICQKSRFYFQPASRHVPINSFFYRPPPKVRPSVFAVTPVIPMLHIDSIVEHPGLLKKSPQLEIYDVSIDHGASNRVAKLLGSESLYTNSQGTN